MFSTGNQWLARERLIQTRRALIQHIFAVSSFSFLFLPFLPCGVFWPSHHPKTSDFSRPSIRYAVAEIESNQAGVGQALAINTNGDNFAIFPNFKHISFIYSSQRQFCLSTATMMAFNLVFVLVNTFLLLNGIQAIPWDETGPTQGGLIDMKACHHVRPRPRVPMGFLTSSWKEPSLLCFLLHRLCAATI